MKYGSKYRFIYGGILGMLTLLAATGCIADDLSGCFRGISMKVEVDAPGEETAVKDISLYVYDDNDKLLDIIHTDKDGTIILDYPGTTATLRCVAWGNVKNAPVTVTALKPGDPLAKGFVSLQKTTGRDAADTYRSPSDLFFGTLQIENNRTPGRTDIVELPVSRKVASMNITVRGFTLLAGTTSGKFSVVVHETPSRVDFTGRFSGTPAAYAPQGSLNAKNEFIVPAFNLFPTAGGAPLTVDLYHEGTLLKSVTTDSAGRPIVPQVGKTLNLLLNYVGNVDVQIAITGWGDTYVWKDYL